MKGSFRLFGGAAGLVLVLVFTRVDLGEL